MFIERFVRRTRDALLLLCVALAASLPAWAWGERGHRMVNAAAVENLPEPLRSYFRARKEFLVEHAIDPDRLAQTDPDERPHHYTEIEAYDSYPFHPFRKEFVEEHRDPTPFQLRHGDSIWQIERFTLRLAVAFRGHRWREADEAALFAAHYACDLTQPLHTAINYDGQLTYQGGLHARFESDLVNARAYGWVLDPLAAVKEPDLRARIFREYVASYGSRNVIFAADHIAVFDRSYADPEYLTTFYNLAELMAKKRLRAAISFVSSLWYTAWVRAGQPDLERSSRSQVSEK